MFENHFINCKILNCKDHSKNPVTHICLDNKCSEHPLLCADCLPSKLRLHNQHQSCIKDVNNGLAEIAKKIQINGEMPSKAIGDIMDSQRTKQLIDDANYINRQKHLSGIKNVLQIAKTSLQSQMGFILQRFKIQLEKQKNAIYLQLDKFYSTYCQKFERFSKLVVPIILMHGSYKHYQTDSSIVLKLTLQTDKERLKSWFVNLKKSLVASEQINTNTKYHQYVQQVKKIGASLNELMEELPTVKTKSYEQELDGILKQFSHQTMKSLFSFKDTRTLLKSNQHSRSANSRHISSRNINNHTHTNNQNPPHNHQHKARH